MGRYVPNGSSSAVIKSRKNRNSAPTVAEMLESIVGCKWSLRVLDVMVAGTHRPSDMVRACPGLSAKVLNERLRKLVRFKIAQRVVFAEVPPRVEYSLTGFGKQFIPLVTAVRELQVDLESD